MTAAAPAGLTDTHLLDAWEAGHARGPVDRAALLYDVSRAADAKVRLQAVDADSATLGMVDAGLLDCREATFGSRVEALAVCPACDESLEFGFDLDAIRTGAGRPDDRFEVTSPDGRSKVIGRLPTVADLRAASVGENVEAARRILGRRCVVAATREGEPADVATLPDQVLAMLGAAMADRDRQADTRLALTCPACGHGWDTRFDIAAFLWHEIDARARRLLVDIHTLATAYGWTEAEILALPRERRRAYLELVLG
jgi:hypothetical protein